MNNATLIGSAAWNTTIEKATTLGKANAGFRLTPLEVGAAVALCAIVSAAYVVRTYRANAQERRERNKFEQARAADLAQAELSAFKSAVADADSTLTRLQAFRRDNLISAHRELRLPRNSFANDDHLFAAHQQLLHRFTDACAATLGHVAELRKLTPQAAAHRPDVFGADLMETLVLG